jgi:biopolymer transport protein ExbD
VKFPRNARIFRGRLDVAPFAAVLFLLILFLAMASLVYTPGVSLQLPVADSLPGTDKPTVAVAIDANGRFYFQNQLTGETELKKRLSEAARKAGEPLTLLVQADKAVNYEQLLAVTMLARNAGISNAWLATLPRTVPVPAARQP